MAAPLFGVLTQTAAGRDRLTPQGLHRWTRRWAPEAAASDWWLDRDAGVALFRPEAMLEREDGVPAVLAVRGAVTRGGRREPPSGWPGLPPAAGTAALLYDLLERDTAAIEALRGQFSLAFWDGRRRRLLLCRDHLGQRGMFWRRDGEHTVFCSELEPLLSGGHCRLDPESAMWYLAFGMPPTGRTLAAEVDRVPAAHVLSFDPGRPPGEHRYWTPLSAEAPRDADDETVAGLRMALDRAVAAALPNYEPAGLLLSGGVDSTYLAATMAGFGSTPAAFTAAFESAYGMNETEYAAAVANWLRLNHHVITLDAGQARQILDSEILTTAEPCAAWATITYDRVLAAASDEGISAVVSGLGADEIFGGYDHFRGYYSRYLRYQQHHRLPAGAHPFQPLLNMESQAARRVLYPGVARFFDDGALADALSEEFRGWHYASRLRDFYRDCLRLKPDAQPMELMVAHECQHRIPDLLHANFDPVARRFGVRLEYPFLDPDVVQLAAGLSAESRYRTASGRFSLRRQALHPRFKHAMLRVAEDRVPELIRQRSRKSLTAPFGAWMTDPSFALPVIDRLRRSSFWDTGVLRRGWLDEILTHVEARPSPWMFQLWAVLTLAGWWDCFIDPPGR